MKRKQPSQAQQRATALQAEQQRAAAFAAAAAALRPSTAPAGSVESVQRAVNAALARSSHISDAVLVLREYATTVAIPFPAMVRPLEKLPMVETRCALINALYRFTVRQTAPSFRALLSALYALDGRILLALDRTAPDPRPLSETRHVRAPDPVAPMLSRAPSTALEWQTHPSIGLNPELVTLAFESTASKPRRPRKPRAKRPAPRTRPAAPTTPPARPVPLPRFGSTLTLKR